MKVIIAGSRGINSPRLVLDAIEQSGFTITEVVSGGAWGVDKLGEVYALGRGLPVKQFIPDWGGHAGARAGFVRNSQMGEYADALIAIWDGRSRGTRHMISVMERLKKPHYVHNTFPQIKIHCVEVHNARLPRSDE